MGKRKKWRVYEAGKGVIADRVLKSDKDGKEAARMYEREIKRLCNREKI